MDHAILSPSSSSRWTVCTRAPRLEAAFEDNESEAAKEGTFAHSIVEALLNNFKRNGLTKLTLAEWKFFKEDDLFNEAMLEYCEKFANYVLANYEEGDILSIEQKLNLNNWAEDSFGHSDANILQVKKKHLHVFDYKFGKGVPVFAKKNTQLMLYALGVIDMLEWLGYEIEKVTLHIYQPRIANNSEYTLSVADLLYWGRKTLRPAAKLAFAGEGEFVAGKHCHFCKAAPRCRALEEYNTELAKYDFDEPELLNPSEMVDIFERKKIFEVWLKSVSDYMLTEAVKGKKWPGYKLVEGRADRVYTSEANIIKTLEKLLGAKAVKIYKPQSLHGITELTKILGTENFNAYVGQYLRKPNGAPTLAPDEDERPVFNGASMDFKDAWIDPDELTYDNL